ncbi:MAG: LytR C-terminal domain-containing protein [Acidimicrobiia bacterium]
MSDDGNSEPSVPEEQGEALRPEDIELTPVTVRWGRIALFFLVAATTVALTGLGSEGRAAGVFGALGAGFERIQDETSSVWDGTRSALQDVALLEPEPVGAAAPAGSFSTAIVVEDADGVAASVLLAVADPNGAATLIVFPSSLATTIPGYGDFPLAETARFEDAALTAVTLTNLLGVRVDATVGLTAEEFTLAVGSPVSVDLPTDVIVPAGDGGTVLAERGVAVLQPSLLAAVLLTQGESNELAWLERQGAVWEALFTSTDVDGLIAALDAKAGPGEDAAPGLQAVASGSPLTVSGPPLAEIGIGTDEQLVLRGADADSFVLSRMPHLLIREGPRPRVEVLNGNGRTQTTRLVAETLVRRGFKVIKTDNADSFDYRDSRVISQGRGNRLPGAEIVELLGVGQLELEVRAPSGVVDVSIIVGQDIPIGESS